MTEWQEAVVAGAIGGVFVTAASVIIAVPALRRTRERRLRDAAVAWFVAAVAHAGIGALAAHVVGPSSSGFLSGLLTVILLKFVGSAVVEVAVRRSTGERRRRAGYLPMIDRPDLLGDLGNALLACPLRRAAPANGGGGPHTALRTGA